MKIKGFIWLKNIVEKIENKHNVYKEEVKQVFKNYPKFRYIEKGKIRNENLYAALGRTDAGRYLTVFFIYKKTKEALIITARDMNKKERRNYEKI